MELIFNHLETKKKIYAQNTYMTFAKSILHLPIFQSVKNGERKRTELKIDSLYGYKNVEMRFYPLSVGFDFDVFYYILQKKIKSENLSFTINLNQFMKFHKVHPSNKKVYIEKLKQSLDNMLDFYLNFSYGPKTYKCHLLTHVEENEENREEIKITFSKFFENFYKHDPDLIFNLQLDQFKEISGDYAKMLYMFYFTNKYESAVEFKIENIMKRLNSEGYDRKEVLKNIKKAHEQLISIGFLKSAKPIKNGRELAGYEIEFEKRRGKPLIEPKEKEKEKEKDITADLSLCDEELPF